MATEVIPHDFPQVGWQGHWIWIPEEPIVSSGHLSAGINPHALEVHGLFRKKIHLDLVPDRAPTRITADSRYALFVNGQEVFRGPIRSQPRRLHYDLFAGSVLMSCDCVPSQLKTYAFVPPIAPTARSSRPSPLISPINSAADPNLSPAANPSRSSICVNPPLE